MFNRALAPWALALVLAGGCSVTNPWQDTLETPEVAALKADYSEPMRYKAVVGLRVDPLAFRRVPADDLAALRDEAASLASEVRDSQGAADQIAARGLLTPEALYARITPLLGEAKSLLQGYEPKNEEIRKSAAGFVAKAEALAAKVREIRAGLAEAAADEAKRGPLAERDAEAGAECQSLTDAAGSLADSLLAAGHARAETFKLALEGLKDALNQLIGAAADVQEGKFEEAGTKLDAAAAAVSAVCDEARPLAAGTEGAPARLEALAAAAEGLVAAGEAVLPAIGESLKSAGASARAALEAVQAAEPDAAKAAAALQDVSGHLELAGSRAAAEAEKGSKGPLAAAAEAPRLAAARAQAFSGKIEGLLADEGAFEEETRVALTNALRSAGEAGKALESAAAAAESGNAGEAKPLFGAATAAAEAARSALAAEAEELAGDADREASFQPEPADFVDVFVKNLQGFEMFQSVEALAGPAREAPVAEYLDASAVADADFLVLVEPLRNNLRYMGFNANWYYNVWIWAFAWLASNFVPDETWESRIELKVSVLDVRSGETLFSKTISSAASLNLADTDDGWQLFGIVLGSCSRACLEQAYPKVLPYHLGRIRAELLRDLAVEFKAYTAGDEFAAKRKSAKPAAFGVVVGVGQYASDRFAGGTAEAAPKAAGLLEKAEKSRAALAGVAEALAAQARTEGASGVPECVQALRKAAKLLEVAGPEFLSNDVPPAARSAAEAKAAFAEVRTRLQGVLPKPENLDAILAEADALAKEAEAFEAGVAQFAPDPAVVAVGRKAGLLVADAQDLPRLLREAAAKLGEEGAGLEAVAQALGDAAAALQAVEASLARHSVPPAASSVENVLAAVAMAFDALEPLKGKAIEAAAASGKVGFLKTNLEAVLAEIGAVKAPEALAQWAEACAAISKKAGGLLANLEAFEEKAAGRAAEQKGVVQAAGPAAEGAAEAAALLKEAVARVAERKGTEAAAKLKAAGEKAGAVAAALEPVVKDLPTLVGEALKVQKAVEALAASQEAALAETEKTPGGDAVAGFVPQQEEVAKELKKAAAAVETEAGSLKAAGNEADAAEAAKAAESLKTSADAAAGAAVAFGLKDSPGGLAKMEEAAALMKASRDLLKALGPKVPDIGKEAFAMDGLIGRQEGLFQEAKAVAENQASVFDALAGVEESVLAKAREAGQALLDLPKAFPGAEKELPEALAAVAKAAEEMDVVLKRGAEAAAMLKKGDVLGGAREQKGITERLRAVAAVLAGSVQGRRTHVDLIQEVVGDLKAVREESARVAAALEEGASRYMVDRAADDAAAFAEFLGDPAGPAFASTRLTALLNEKATAAGIREAFGEVLRNRVLENDLFVFYFAGCGGLMKVPFERKSDVLAWVPKFKSLSDRLARLSDAAAALKPSPAVEELRKALVARANAVAGLAEAAGAAAVALESDPADETKALAAKALKDLPAKLVEPAQGCADAEALLAALEAAQAAAKARACLAALKAAAEGLASVPEAAGVPEIKKSMASEAATLEEIAGRLESLSPPESVNRLVADLKDRVSILREDEKALAALSAECAGFTPEPAAAVAAAALALSETVVRLEEAAALFGKCAVGEGRAKLAEALASAQGAQAVLESMGARMEDLYTHVLLPYDADPARPAETGIPLYEIGRMLAGLRARHMVLVFDASFAAGAPKRGFGVFSGPEPKKADDEYVRYVALGEDWTVIFAGGPGEGAAQTAKGGALTAALLEGARGAADADSSGKVTLEELGAFLQQQVPAASAASGAPHKPVVRSRNGALNAFEPAPVAGSPGGEGGEKPADK